MGLAPVAVWAMASRSAVAVYCRVFTAISFTERSDGKLLPGGITHRNHADPDHLLPKRERQRSQGHKLMNPAMEAGARRSGDDFGKTGADVVSHLHPEIQP